MDTTSDPQTIIVTNAGTVELAIGAVSLSGDDSEHFSKNDNCQETTLDVGRSCIINVKFNPIASGSQRALVEIYDDASDSPQEVLASGTGTSGAGGCALIAAY